MIRSFGSGHGLALLGLQFLLLATRFAFLLALLSDRHLLGERGWFLVSFATTFPSLVIVTIVVVIIIIGIVPRSFPSGFWGWPIQHRLSLGMHFHAGRCRSRLLLLLMMSSIIITVVVCILLVVGVIAGSGRGIGQLLGLDLCVGLFDFGFVDQVSLDFLDWTRRRKERSERSTPLAATAERGRGDKPFRR